jgi:uncharacterized membrane protein YdjX (TVP38/TMEM64 family)
MRAACLSVGECMERNTAWDLYKEAYRFLFLCRPLPIVPFLVYNTNLQD